MTRCDVIHVNESDPLPVREDITAGVLRLERTRRCHSLGPLLRMNQAPVIVGRAPIEAALDDLAAKRRQVGLAELVQAFGEERIELLGARVVGRLAHLGLCVHVQHPGGDAAALDVELLRDVAQERTASRLDLVRAGTWRCRGGPGTRGRSTAA